MHDVLPWQRDLLVLGDTSKTLAPSIELKFEREANQGDAELLFQIDLLKRMAVDYPTEIATPIALAGIFGASIHSTFRRWIEEHEGGVCGIAIDPEPACLMPLAFRRYEVIVSRGWRARFGAPRFPARLNAAEYGFLVPLSTSLSGSIDADWALSDLSGSACTVRVQSFNNSYRTFVLLWVPAKESFIARHRRPPRLEVG